VQGGELVRPWAGELAARLVVGDQIEVIVRRSHPGRQHLRLLVGVVHPPQDHVLEHDLAVGAPHVPRARREHLIQRIRAVEGHQAVAYLVGGGVEAHREVELQRFLGEAVDARRHTDRRHRDGPRRQIEAGLIVEKTAGAQRLVVVVERLAHAHEDDVGHAALVVSEQSREMEHLVDHLLSREIAAQTETTGGAESAPDGAADLGRHAHGGAFRIGHEHGLDGVTVGGREQGLAGGAARRGARLDILERERAKALRQRPPQRRRKAGHAVEIDGEAPREGLVDLTRPVRRLSQLRHHGGDGVRIDHAAIVPPRGKE